jgi:hypothetical protein
MTDTKSYIIENHNLSSYNHTGNPVVFSGEANLSALNIDGGVTPYKETFWARLSAIADERRRQRAIRQYRHAQAVQESVIIRSDPHHDDIFAST